MRLVKWFLFFTLLALGVMMATVHWLENVTVTPLSLTEPVTLQVKAGDSMGSIIHRLAKNKQIKNGDAFWFWVRITDAAQKIHMGEYQLNPGITPLELIEKLTTGDVIAHRFTVVEGTRFSDVLQLLANNPSIKSTLKGKTTREIMDAIGIPKTYLTPEGWFFPDTYQITKGETDLSVLRRGYKKMHTVLHKIWEDRETNLPLETPYDALILASIIEKETGVVSERPEIAGVFVRRLRQGMRLQTDPTVVYGMGENYHGNIRRKDLRKDTPYNTYTRHGLTPTPIALAGQEAVYAALHPKQGETLYFVAKGDGTHYFSVSLSEHQEAVKRYQLSRKKDYRSSPQQ